MSRPRASRPYMPGYPTVPTDEGMLDWSEIDGRLASSRDYWVASRTPDGSPHVMPVWGLWQDGTLWFSSGRESRKARNLLADPRVSVATSDAQHPAVVEGIASEVTDEAAIRAFAAAINNKYGEKIEADFYLNPGNSVFRIEPRKVLALTESEFARSPTRFTFD